MGVKEGCKPKSNFPFKADLRVESKGTFIRSTRILCRSTVLFFLTCKGQWRFTEGHKAMEAQRRGSSSFGLSFAKAADDGS